MYIPIGLFYAYTEEILRKLDDISGFIIGVRHLINVRYTDDVLLIVDKNKTKELYKVLKEIKKEGANISCEDDRM